MEPKGLAGQLPGKVAASLREGDDLGGPGPGCGRCDGPVGSDGDFDGASLVAVLDDVDLAAARVDANVEALYVLIPDDALSLGGDEGVNGALCDLGHGP